MDWSAILGITCGAALMLACAVVGGSPLAIFVDSSALLCVVGGALCATLVANPWRVVIQLPGVLARALFHRPSNAAEVIEQLNTLAERARRDGLLALESRLDDVHPLLREGVQMAIDGTRPDTIEEVLRSEMRKRAHRHTTSKQMLEQMGKYAPAFGMVGTLIGLVMMLHGMTDPSTIASGMAVALLTTLYGALLANLICLPAADKLGYYHRQDTHVLELIVTGVLAIQSGENPRRLIQRLSIVTPRAHQQAA